jgi:hypothetical protein
VFNCINKCVPVETHVLAGRHLIQVFSIGKVVCRNMCASEL